MVSTRSLPPGGEAEILAKLRTTGITGPVRKQITVFTNDPANPRLTLSLTGEVVADVVALPRQVAFGEVPMGSDPSRELTLKVEEPRRVRITGVAVDDERFRLSRLDGDEATGARYELRMVDTSTRGWISAHVTVHLAGAQQETLQVNVTGSVVGDLKYPKSFTMRRNGEEGGYAPDELIIQSRSGKPIEILGVTDAQELLEATVTQDKPDVVRLKLTVKAPPGEDSPTQRGKLSIRTTDPAEPTFEVGYSLWHSSRPVRRPPVRRAPLLAGERDGSKRP